jgi:hypothetical protein
MKTDDDWDFGFSAIDPSELESVQAADKITEKADTLYSMILPLLKRLKENPEKEYIFWPNRVEKVEEFEKKLKKVYEM